MCVLVEGFSIKALMPQIMILLLFSFVSFSYKDFLYKVIMSDMFTTTTESSIPPTKWGRKPSQRGAPCREETGWPVGKMNQYLLLGQVDRVPPFSLAFCKHFTTFVFYKCKENDYQPKRAPFCCGRFRCSLRFFLVLLFFVVFSFSRSRTRIIMKSPAGRPPGRRLLAPPILSLV